MMPVGPARIWVEGGPFADAEGWTGAIAAAKAASPYLERLCRLEPEVEAMLAAGEPQVALQAATALAAGAGEGPLDEVMAALRIAKRRAHLAIALADLAGAWSVMEVTGALSDFADVAVRAALRAAARGLAARGELPQDAAVPGLIVIAMGKHGAGELNFSSDVDFSVFFDAETLPARDGEPRRLAVKLAQSVVRLLEEMTPDGYVFRTDLRLRPDPASTAVAVSLAAAEIYYQSLGQNWERAAFIKARPLAGDLVAGEAFLKSLGPFVWRRHLDYAAIADIRSIKRQILSTHKGGAIDSGVFDVKLGRGGIRDIELFAQTQQLILGGRDPALRSPRTLEALAALAKAGRIAPESEAALAEAYLFFRAVEHRIQMLNDEQTHRPPSDPLARERLAALCGFESFAALADDLLQRRRIVAAIDEALFGEEDSLADPLGPLVFTGVEDDPDTLETLRKMGYGRPAEVAAALRGWHHGRVRAMRAERARELLTALTPRLLRSIAESGDADGAFARFETFMAALPSGVQLFSLLQAQPEILESLAATLGLAPMLADDLARRPALFDAFAAPDFVRPLAQDPPEARRTALMRTLCDSGGFEGALNAARRFHREEALRIGMQALTGRARASEAGRAYADLAEACVAGLAEQALEAVEKVHGPEPGAFAVVALGKFGGSELSPRSDLDVMLVFDADPEARSAGQKPLAPGEFYGRLTQRLISALSAPTEEGLLYDVDMQLRPSGSKGPVAVSFSAFDRYYGEDAWTWELLALTRARVVAGSSPLATRIMASVRANLERPRDGAKILADAAAMRAKMDKERPPAGFWDLKLSPGGLVDIEFIAQTLTVRACAEGRKVSVEANTGAALAALAEAGEIAPSRSAALTDAWRLYGSLNAICQLALPGRLDPATAPPRLLTLLAEMAGAADFAALTSSIAAQRLTVRALLHTLLATEP